MSSDQTATPRKQVLFLTRAESRVQIMDALSTSAPATQPELRARLEASRTTVSRALNALAEKGWVEKSDGAYRLTRPGQLLARELTHLFDEIERIEELTEFLRLFPADMEVPDLLGASDLEVTYPTDADPYRPARKQTQILSTADRLRILLPAIDLDSTKAITEQVTEQGLEVETIVPPGVASTMESEAYAPVIEQKVRTGRSAVYVAQDSVPFYLGLTADGRVQVGLADDDGLPRALLETTDERVRTWAQDVYQDVRERAERKSVADF